MHNVWHMVCVCMYFNVLLKLKKLYKTEAAASSAGLPSRGTLLKPNCFPVHLQIGAKLVRAAGKVQNQSWHPRAL